MYDDKKGGDIDILVETAHNLSMKDKLVILIKINVNGILRKVDILFRTPSSKQRSIFDTITKEEIVL